MFWLGRRAPNISFRFLEHATSLYGMFNGDSGEGHLDLVLSAASSSHHVGGGDSVEYEDLIIILTP